MFFPQFSVVYNDVSCFCVFVYLFSLSFHGFPVKMSHMFTCFSLLVVSAVPLAVPSSLSFPLQKIIAVDYRNKSPHYIQNVSFSTPNFVMYWGLSFFDH